MGLIRTILIIGVIYYGLKLIGRYLFPYMVNRFMNKQHEAFNQQRQHTPNESYSKQSDKKTFTKKEKLGDYVDFEEVD